MNVDEIRPLTSLRGIAALWVVLYHFNPELLLNREVRALTALVHNGYLLVDLFFVLSGFVLMQAYGDHRWSGRTAGAFLVRRFARIWPLHVFVLLAMAFPLQLVLPSGSSLGELAANLLLVHSWGLYDHLTWNEPSWSISTEWFMYLVFPLTSSLVRRGGTAQHLTTIGVAAVPVALLALGENGLDVTFDYGLVRCAASFVAGMAVQRLVRDRERIGRARVPLVCAATLSVLGVLHFDACDALAVGGFVVLVAALGAPGPEDVVSRVLSLGPLHWAGRVSYSIYMVHWPLLGLWSAVTRSLDLGAWASTLLAVVVLVLATSALTHRWIEEPLRIAGNRIAVRIGGGAARM